MSAYMVRTDTLSTIAKFLALCASDHSCCMRPIRDIEAPASLKSVLKSSLCYDELGLCSVERVYGLLWDENAKAIKASYSNWKEMTGEKTPFKTDAAFPDVYNTVRREWLANLYTVCRCYRYQTMEGDFKKNKFWLGFSEWIDKMAAELADYVVKKVRPDTPSQYKPWDEF